MRKIFSKAILHNIRGTLRQLRSSLFDTYSVKSYSQEGEDMILRRMFENVDKGFYVDVGAYHPRQFSNTYFFYKKGWSGINIDATPGSMRLFERVRPRDINIETAIAKHKQEMTFFMFNESALNTFDVELACHRKNGILKEKKISTKRLEEVLVENLPNGQRIHFLTIDVEGLDLEILQSNNWQLARPECILIECIGLDLNKIKDNMVYQFLDEKNYVFFAKTFYTLIFRDRLLS